MQYAATAAALPPAQTYDAHRQRALAAAFPTAVAFVVALTLAYAIADLLRAPSWGQAVGFGCEVAVPLIALALTRGAWAGRVELLALAADLAFTAVLAGRLWLPATTVSGTALFLAIKLLATALLFPWRAPLQYLSAASTMLLYYAAVALTGHRFDSTHQAVGPIIAAVLSCLGAAVADRTRRALWQQSVDLAAAAQRTRSLLDTERILVAVAREISVVTDLGTALDRVNSLTAAALECDFSNTYLIDDQRGEAVAAATNASQPELRAQILAVRRSLEQPILAELLRGRTVVINDPDDQRWFERSELAGVSAVALTPIMAKGKVLGVLTATRTQSGAGFGERESGLLEAIAAQAAIAIENARLFEGLRASEARYRDLFERATEQERETQELLAQLREANRLQAEFVANMSHELRTPLNVIIGYSDLIADEPSLAPESDAGLFLRRIAASGRALHRLVESVLEYARLDRGRSVVIATRFAATKLLAELRGLCGDVPGSTDVELSIQETSDIVFLSDYDRLYSILSNLLLNAVKFTGDGRIELRLRRVGDHAEFAVSDTGIGIAPEELAHVFEPFRQVDGSPTRCYGGVGLGLAIVRRNVELLEGRVEVESELGVGSTFRVRVPIAVHAAADEERAPNAA